MRIGPLLAHLLELETGLAVTLRAVAEQHRDEHDVFHQCHTFALAAEKRVAKLESLSAPFDGHGQWTTAVDPGRRDDLLEALRTLYLCLREVATTWTMAVQGAQALRDTRLLDLAAECEADCESQAKWLTTRIKTAAPQALVTAAVDASRR